MNLKTKIDLIELLEKWHKVKKEKEETYPMWSNGDETIKLWFNPWIAEWTSLESHAFKGFVAREISSDIDKLWKS